MLVLIIGATVWKCSEYRIRAWCRYCRTVEFKLSDDEWSEETPHHRVPTDFIIMLCRYYKASICLYNYWCNVFKVFRVSYTCLMFVLSHRIQIIRGCVIWGNAPSWEGFVSCTVHFVNLWQSTDNIHAYTTYKQTLNTVRCSNMTKLADGVQV